MQKAEKLQNLAGFGSDFVDTSRKSIRVEIDMPYTYSPPDTDNEIHLRLGRNVEVTSSTGGPLQTDLLLLLVQVLLYVLLSPLEDDNALGLGSL